MDHENSDIIINNNATKWNEAEIATTAINTLLTITTNRETLGLKPLEIIASMKSIIIEMAITMMMAMSDYCCDNDDAPPRVKKTLAPEGLLRRLARPWPAQETEMRHSKK